MEQDSSDVDDERPPEENIGDIGNEIKFSNIKYTKENYKEVSQEMVKEFIENLNNEGKWTFLKEQDGTKVFYTEDEEIGIRLIRGQCEVPACATSIAELVCELKNTDIVDIMAMSEHIKMLETFPDPLFNICNVRFKLPWPLYPRDFVYGYGFEWIENKGKTNGISWGYSVIDERAPPVSGVVRGEILCSGYCMRDIGDYKDKKSQIDYIVQVDPKGYIPTFVVNLVAADQAQNCTRIRQYFEENGDPNPRPPGTVAAVVADKLTKNQRKKLKKKRSKQKRKAEQKVKK